MNKVAFVFALVCLMLSSPLHGQEIARPKGCSATTGPGVPVVVLQHPESRYTLIATRWADIEPSPGVFSFSVLQQNINLVKSYNKKYALAVVMGGPGSPAWLIDSLHVPFVNYRFRNVTPYKLPLWWDTTVQNRIATMVNAVANQFRDDTSLALVYVTQMTANGNEGHLQYVNMDTMRLNGYTEQKWIDAATQTARAFANAFPTKPLAFELHEIENSAYIPTTIMNGLYSDTSLHRRVGAAMWWLSGKTTYQPALLDFLRSFSGDKYAQLIGHSGQPERFADSSIATAFAQAKQLNIRYIEPWNYEYQTRNIDTLLHDFNLWVDSVFVVTSVGEERTNNLPPSFQLQQNYPNPFNPSTTIRFSLPQRSHVTLKVFDVLGREVATLVNENLLAGRYSYNFDASNLSNGVYFYKIQASNYIETKKMILMR